MLTPYNPLFSNASVCLLPEVERVEEVCLAHSKFIVIVSQNTHGLGDVKIAIEIYRFIKETFSRFSVKLLTHALIQHKFDVFLDANFTDFVTLIEGAPPPADLTIHFPSSHSFIHQLIPYLVGTNRRHVMLNDYGFEATAKAVQSLQSRRSKLDWRSLGIHEEDSLGVIFNRELHITFLQDLSDIAKMHRFIPKLPNKMKQALMGGQSLEEFSLEWHLHLGYSSAGASKVLFVQSVARLMKNNPNKSKLCFVLVGAEIDFEMTNFMESLKKENVGKLEYFSATSEQEEPTKKYDLQISHKADATVVRVYSVPKVNEKTMVTLRQASRRETLVTGTQSLIEAITLGHYPLYEKLAHIHDFLLDISYQALFQSRDLGLFLLDFLPAFPLVQHDFGDQHITQLYQEEDVRIATSGFKKMNHLDDSYRKFVDYFYQRWDFGPRIKALIQGYLGNS